MSEDFLSAPMEKMLAENADMVAFGYVRVGDFSRSEVHVDNQVLNNDELIKCYLHSDMGGFAWNKVYKARLFQDVRYPEMCYEDIAALCRLVSNVKKCVVLNRCLYYYVQRISSTTRTGYQPKNLDLIRANYEWLKMIKEKYPHYEKESYQMVMFSMASVLYKILYWGTYRRDKEVYEKIYGNFMTMYYQAAEKYPDNDFLIMRAEDSYLKAYCVDIIKRPRYFKFKSCVVGLFKRTARRILGK